MAFTREQFERRLVRDNQRPLLLLERSVDASGADEAMGGFIGEAMLRLGYGVADPANPTDAELAAVVPARLPDLILVADTLLKASLEGDAVAVPSEADGENRIEFSDIAKNLRRVLNDRAKAIDKITTAYANRGVVVAGKVAPKPKPPDAVETSWLEEST